MSGSRRVRVVWKRIIGLLAVVLATILLQGCSAIKLGYNNASGLVYWWVDGYADLDDDQSVTVRAELDRLLLWHRASELPRIAELLQKTRLMALGDTTPEQVCAIFGDVRARIDAVITRAEAPTVAVAMTLRPAQLSHMEARFAKGNKEWQADWVDGSASDRQERRLKSSIERTEQFYGTLEERQIAALQASLRQSAFDPPRSFAERQRRQRDMLQTLRTLSTTPRPGSTEAMALMRGMLQRTVESPDPAYRSYSERAIFDVCRRFAVLHNATTPEQRERAARRLAAYERDARELAARS